MSIQPQPVQRDTAPSAADTLMLAVFVVAAIILIVLVVGVAFLPSTTFEIPEPVLPILDWTYF